METLYRIFEISGMLISLACCAIVMRGKPSENQQKLLMTCIWGLTAAVGNVMEVFAASPEAAMVAIKVAYIGKCYIMTSGLMFVSGYSSVKLPKGLVTFLGAANTAVLVTVMSCEKHQLYYKSIDYEMRPNGRAAMLFTQGPFYFVWLGLLLFGAGVYVIIARREMKRGSRVAKLRMTAIFWAVAMPMVAAISFLIIKPVYFDPATLAITMAEICFLLAVKRYGLLDTMELAQERIIEDTRDGVVVIDNTKSMILYQNQVAQSLIRRMTQINGGFDLERFTREHERVYELDGRHYEFRVSEIRRSEGSSEIQGYVVWIFDMTFIDEYTSEMIRLKEESEKANQAKTDFLANISHEIRTPMNSIVGCAELALKNQDEQIVHGYLKKIKKSSYILLHLINELIDITQIERGKIKSIKVNYSFTELADDIRHQMETLAGEAGLAFIVQLDSELPKYLYGDRVKVQEIIISLITNSIKYTKEGSVTLRARLKERADKRALINIEVEDTGIGISEAESEKVFAKFERIDRRKNNQVEGSGLGLSIAKSFVDMMDGTISYESEYGRGTRFIVDIWQELGKDEQDYGLDLPETDSAADSENEKSDDAGGKSLENVVINSGHIMIVDDNMLNLDVASGIMELLGMSTRTAISGNECLELLEDGEKPDIIFMDHMMPEMDGLETMKKIRELEGSVATLPIVLLTANAIAGVKEQMLEEGFDDFLSKPIEIDELRRILIRFLGEKGCQAVKTSI